MRLGILISNAGNVLATHTTLHIAAAAVARGHSVRFVEPWDLDVDPRGRLVARAHCVEPRTGGWTREALAAALDERTLPRRSVHALDVLLLRANPLDPSVLTFAMLAEAAGVRVRNTPGGILRTSHKAWLASLTDVPRPRTLVTRSPSAAARFAADCPEGTVVKPARSCGGKGVGFVPPGRGRQAILDTALERALALGDGWAVVQAYLPEATEGEKRLLWVEGRLIGGYLRERAPGEWRHNLKVGAEPHPTELTEHDHAIAAAVGPHLRAAGIWFAGLDVIGAQLVEVNTLNPGGAHHTGAFTGVDVGGILVRSLEDPADPGGVGVLAGARTAVTGPLSGEAWWPR